MRFWPKSPPLFVDQQFSPVPLIPADSSIEMSLETNQERHVCVRGKMETNLLASPRAVPRIVAAYLDSELVPFTGVGVRTQFDDWRIVIAPASPTECPIPPCDSEPARARGSLPDVAAQIGADQLWLEGVHGEGIVIGIVDGGILAEGRTESYGAAQNVVDGWPTANWGTITGWGKHATMLADDIRGIAPKATMYDIRIFDPDRAAARVSDAIAGIHWAIEKHRATGRPHILCCGWGIYQQSHDHEYASKESHPLTRKIVEAIDEGIIVLFAAGNGGQCCPATACGDDVGPGRSIWGANGHPRVMTIGAVNIDEQLIGYSSQGPAALDDYKPDFCAISHFQGYFPNDSGTSVACAVAAAVVALLKQVRPTLTQEAAKRLLKSTSKDIGPPGWDRHSGSGIIQAKAAYDKLVGAEPCSRVDFARLEQLQAENRCLKELFVELALERRMERASNSIPNDR